jgi:transcriptional regulator with XRE-family HTH domain
LTDAAGLSKGALSKIENGIVDPRSTTLVRVARAMGIKLGPCIHEAEKKAAS